MAKLAHNFPVSLFVPVAHSCHSCGLSLTRVRAGLDAALGLQVVVCPECRVACVRRRPELALLVRRACAARRTGAALVLRLGALMLAALAVFGTGHLMLKFHEDTPLLDVLRHLLGLADYSDLMRTFRDDYRFVGAGMWLFAGTLGATACFAMFPHLGRVKVWGVFLGVLLAIALVQPTANMMVELSRGPLDRAPRIGGRAPTPAIMETARTDYFDALRRVADKESRTLLGLGAVTGVSLVAGMPVGAVVGTRLRRLGMRWVVHRRWRLRRKLRTRRNTG